MGPLFSHWEEQSQVCVLHLGAKGLEQVDPQPVDTIKGRRKNKVSVNCRSWCREHGTGVFYELLQWNASCWTGCPFSSDLFFCILLNTNPLEVGPR